MFEYLFAIVWAGSATIYERVNEIVSYPRCWRRGQTLGADRFEADLAQLRPAAKRSRAQQRLFGVLDGYCSQAMLEGYLRDMADTDRALSRQLTELLDLVRQYGPEPVADSIERLPRLVLCVPAQNTPFG